MVVVVVVVVFVVVVAIVVVAVVWDVVSCYLLDDSKDVSFVKWQIFRICAGEVKDADELFRRWFLKTRIVQ